MQLEYFNGFPYMLTLVSGGLFHISILPGDIGLDNLKEIVRWQVSANKLQSCLVLGSSCCVYFDLDGAERISGDIPRGGFNCTGRLRTAWSGSRGSEFCVRTELLRAYLGEHGPRDMVYAELTKGGRQATAEEMSSLEGKQPNGVPLGLSKCERCRQWKGECLDPNPKFAGLIMPVSCACENDTCARRVAERSGRGGSTRTISTNAAAVSIGCRVSRRLAMNARRVHLPRPGGRKRTI